MMLETISIVISVLALSTSVVTYVLLNKRIGKVNNDGPITPDVDELLVNYYYLDVDQISGDQISDLARADTIVRRYLVEGTEVLVTPGEAYENEKKVTISKPPPMLNKALIAVEIRLLKNTDVNIV